MTKKYRKAWVEWRNATTKKNRKADKPSQASAEAAAIARIVDQFPEQTRLKFLNSTCRLAEVYRAVALAEGEAPEEPRRTKRERCEGGKITATGNVIRLADWRPASTQ